MSKLNRQNFVALDRDGTINVELYRPITDPGEIELLPGVIEGLARMSETGLGLFIVTNQSCVGRGQLTMENMDSVNNHLRNILASNGINLEGIYVCTHHPQEGCMCRKPKAGLLNIAASQLNFGSDNCFLIGDKISDIECGRNFGATTILVRTGYGATTESEASNVADYVEDDLQGAAKTIEKLTIDG